MGGHAVDGVQQFPHRGHQGNRGQLAPRNEPFVVGRSHGFVRTAVSTGIQSVARKRAAPMGVRLARWKVRFPDCLSAGTAPT